MTRKTPAAVGNPPPYRGWLCWHPRRHRGTAGCRAPGSGPQCQCADDGQLLGDWPPDRRSRAERPAAGRLRRAVDGAVVRRSDGALWARVQPGKNAALLCRLPLEAISRRCLGNLTSPNWPWSSRCCGRPMSGCWRSRMTMPVGSTRPRRCAVRQLEWQIGSHFYERTAKA